RRAQSELQQKSKTVLWQTTEGSFAARHPFLLLFVVTFFPHILGSIVNISYNQSQIMSGLSAHQQTVFARLVVGYNAVVYPLAFVLIYWLVAPIVRVWRKLGRG